MSVTLPDPTSDLHWGDWEGAIHEIFHKNALKYPARPCVIETNPERNFSYQQIDEASNVLAHHFVSSGVQRGDVVMIYAFRNVDLVVAVMATLKAGAAFSVIDPAYPSDRQVIYLDVARPRVVVVIGKVTGGKLSDTVRTWIEKHLDLKSFVPNLRLHDDGQLTGGIADGADLFSKSQPRRTAPPGIVVGPDSTPSLSFTSGSEGRPKGVLGRHFSLVHYYPWMAKRFGLSDVDRFTMLSGISHDPIQRDIFTPLYLGAQLMVPSAEDIQHEQLALWVQQHKATVTHLTPAMGQILVGNATAQCTNLKNAFFVGDILTKKDVAKLQEIAPHAQIINMFGTTETQRAVSYFAIPSQVHSPMFLATLGDRIPAGKGMNNVQLLIVDRENPKRICSVGEQGEIYVRAAGLAEGYLGLPEASNEKFVSSWFLPSDHWAKHPGSNISDSSTWRLLYKGPRDRLYRSGDLGHYTSSGDVECTGRIDSQIKIRGYRIELGEIDTHLSHHPLVRENITVCRPQQGENTLWSYVVLDQSRQASWLSEQKASVTDDDSAIARLIRSTITTHLKSKVPIYAVPSAIIILNKMPLNPNGKIDKQALRAPRVADKPFSKSQSSTASEVLLSSTEASLAQVWSTLLGLAAPVHQDDSFFELGGHSLLVSRLPSAIRQQFGPINIQLSSIQDYPTLRQYAAAIDRALDPEQQAAISGPGTLYYAEAQEASKQIPAHIPTAECDLSKAHTVLLTGATGFLGAYLLANLLQRSNISCVYAHVRAKDRASASQRIKQTGVAYSLWSESWNSRLVCIAGDLEQERLGIDEELWTKLVEEVDIIVANGARVHWIDPYSKLRAANVTSLLTLFALCTPHRSVKLRPKRVCFVSSTSALDTPHYVSLATQLATSHGSRGIPETDDLAGAQVGLSTGYGQSKWVGEHLMREAGRRGLSGVIVRPGYVLGDSKNGTSITDDFLIRLLKGCTQVGAYPQVSASVNMVPVDTVAAITIAAILQPSPPASSYASRVITCNITSRPRRSLEYFLSALPNYSYHVKPLPFPEWRERISTALDTATIASAGAENALAPLAHLVLGDLPTSTMAPALDDTNSMAALRADVGQDVCDSMALGVDMGLVGKYLGYLVSVGFMPLPSGSLVEMLRAVRLDDEQRDALRALSGRGALH